MNKYPIWNNYAPTTSFFYNSILVQSELKTLCANISFIFKAIKEMGYATFLNNFNYSLKKIVNNIYSDEGYKDSFNKICNNFALTVSTHSIYQPQGKPYFLHPLVQSNNLHFELNNIYLECAAYGLVLYDYLSLANPEIFPPHAFKGLRVQKEDYNGVNFMYLFSKIWELYNKFSFRKMELQKKEIEKFLEQKAASKKQTSNVLENNKRNPFLQELAKYEIYTKTTANQNLLKNSQYKI